MIHKWLIVEFDNVGGSLKGRCLDSFHLSVTKYCLWQLKLVLAVFKTFFLENTSTLPQSNIWGFLVGSAHFLDQKSHSETLM